MIESTAVRALLSFFSLLSFVALAAAAPSSEQQKPANPQGGAPNYVPVHAYDPTRNAARDIEAAAAEARRTRKRVLVEVGGNWCSWCRLMDRFYEQNPHLLALRERHFILVKVDYSSENKKQAVFSRFPKIPGTPHLFVLDESGKLLHSQDTSELEQGQGYNLEKFTAFLKTWSR